MEVNAIQGARTDITEMLSKIREVSNKSKVFSNAGTESIGTENNFGSVMQAAKSALVSVNQTQSDADKIKNAYIAGDDSVSMSQVIISSQKSKLAFEGLVAVRNKILEAYKDIMNMTV